ncbi:glycosyl hydrolase [Sphingomonas aracearum]|uniref:Uncharacterized protein n=1 Tax=Sphingomonas aracearum TaxID=2283317 RepID=A0A369VSD5_9SPHN|nr:glycosyl hydrolase [Sphingomonas aracearum]RDE05306.1 hypothetical protein DVW87_08545 [Sphingomonas aracearum]
MKPTRALLLPLALAAGCGVKGDAAPPTQADAAPMVLGVQTHFSQQWSPRLSDLVAEVGAVSVRDGAAWSAGEPSRGTYGANMAGGASLMALCRQGTSLLLTIVPRNPAYDGGQTVHSAEGIAAYAAYVGRVADRYGRCLAGIEVGNEINTASNLPYPPGVDRAAAYVSLVRATKAELARRHSAAAVLGGSTNVIGTGFLARLFAAGLLEAADAVAVHPYRSQAENVDVEIAHLQSVMRRHGRVLPIWATEFSDNYQTPALAAGELVKATTLLSASGVARAYWYALVDQRWFRNMGLFAASGGTKPAAQAFRQIAPLIAKARAVRVDLGDAGIQAFRLGTGTYVLWGAGGSVAINPAAVVRDARGLPVKAGGTVRVDEMPLVVSGTGALRLAAPSGVIADSLFGYARAPWSYLAQTRDGTAHPLSLADWDWTSSFFSRAYQPLRLADTNAAVAGTAASATRAVLRYTAPASQRISIAGCFHKASKGDGVDLVLTAAGRPAWRQVLTGEAAIAGVDVDLAAGQTVELSAGPNRTAGGDAFNYRLRLFARGAARPVPCPQRPYPAS